MNNDGMKLPEGPIVVTGAGGFVGSRLFKYLLHRGADVWALTHNDADWRLAGYECVLTADITDPAGMAALFKRVAPRTVFHLAAYGAYSHQVDWKKIHITNYVALSDILEIVAEQSGITFIHAGSSSEYGLNASAPAEDALAEPNSHYAVSKLGAAAMLRYFGRVRQVRCCNLRLYSVYGPEEDPARLIPTLLRASIRGQLPPFVDPDIARDFIHVDDVVHAFISAATNLMQEDWGTPFNIGTGVETRICDLAETARKIFGVSAEPQYGTLQRRNWDVVHWRADTRRAAARLDFRASIPLGLGLRRTRDWMLQNPESPTSTGQMMSTY
jgi:dolichol-phosphate mannosyltransferase